MQVGNSRVKKILMGDKVVYQDSDGWIPLELGPEVIGDVFGKIDKEQSCLYLSGTMSVHPVKGGNFQIMLQKINGITFNFEFMELTTIDAHATDGIGLWYMAPNSGNIISNVNVSEDEIDGRLATIVFADYSLGYPETVTNWKITSNNPLKVPITFDKETTL